MIETRNGSDQTLKQHVWGLMYVDELLQIAINGDPATDNDCLETGASDVSYYALQDANYNVLGLVEADGDLAERYEYTPYGQRTIYKSPGSDDPLCHTPILESQRVTADSATATYGLCDIGHQGLMHDKEFGLIYNRARYLHPRLGRFLQRDPLNANESGGGYQDGMSLYGYVRSNPVAASDPSGHRIFFKKSKVKEVSGNRMGTITLYNLLRYTAGACCEEKWGKGNVEKKLKETAKTHAGLLEDYINSGKGNGGKKYTYYDRTVTWTIRLKVITTTEKAYAPAEHDKAIRKELSNDEFYREMAKSRVHFSGEAYANVTVLCEPQGREKYDLAHVPATPDATWTRITHAQLLAHELIGHHLNNYDEANKYGIHRHNADKLRDRLGDQFMEDSIMTYNKGARKFYSRNFAAGIDDVNNITGKPFDRRKVLDSTSELNVKDPWVSRYKKVAPYVVDMIQGIIDSTK